MTISTEEIRKTITERGLDCVSDVEGLELLARLEQAEKERDALRTKAETAENDAAHQKALANSALRVAEGWERKCGEMRAALQHETDCVEAAKAEIAALRAKIEAMERQEPAGTLHDDGYFVWRKTAPHQSNYAGWKMALYLAPGAKGE